LIAMTKGEAPALPLCRLRSPSFEGTSRPIISVPPI
jgi:hypothetical protein